MSEGESRRLPLWFALAPGLTALAMLGAVTGERSGLFPRWLDIVVFTGALLLAAVPFVQRLRGSRRR
jgi:hypothetical protein